MITVHGFSPSGNCHKVRLLLEQLGRRLDRDYAWVETDSSKGATRTPGARRNRCRPAIPSSRS